MGIEWSGRTLTRWRRAIRRLPVIYLGMMIGALVVFFAIDDQRRSLAELERIGFEQQQVQTRDQETLLTTSLRIAAIRERVDFVNRFFYGAIALELVSMAGFAWAHFQLTRPSMSRLEPFSRWVLIGMIIDLPLSLINPGAGASGLMALRSFARVFVIMGHQASLVKIASGIGSTDLVAWMQRTYLGLFGCWFVTSILSGSFQLTNDAHRWLVLAYFLIAGLSMIVVFIRLNHRLQRRIKEMVVFERDDHSVT